MLFSLFTCNLLSHFTGCSTLGIHLGTSKELVGLLYADDLVLLHNCWSGAHKKLSNYCDTNLLTVNVSKTKVVIFKKGGSSRNCKSLYYNGEKLEFCKSFNYLGVPFFSSGKFSLTADAFVKKANLASSKVRDILVRSKSDSLETKSELLRSLVKSVLLYCAEVWGPSYHQKLEVVALRFYKSIFHLARNTPNHFVRLETGTSRIENEILIKMVKWWQKVQIMSDVRLPKLCINKLSELSENGRNNNTKYNWLTQLREKLATIGATFILENKNSNSFKSDLRCISERIRRYKFSYQLSLQ